MRNIYFLKLNKNNIAILFVFCYTIFPSKSNAQNKEKELFNNFDKKYKNFPYVNFENKKSNFLTDYKEGIMYYNKIIWKRKKTIFRNDKIIKSSFRRDSTHYINFAGKDLVKAIFKIESKNKFSDNLLNETKQLIWELESPFPLLLFERAILNLDNSISSDSVYLKNKLLLEIARYGRIIERNINGYYNYNIGGKEKIKFISINTGNDLFRLGAFLPEKFYSKSTQVNIFQQNLDRDYTGSLKIEIGTDYFNFLTRKPVKSYQSISWGFDVYTPGFTDTLIYNAPNSIGIRNTINNGITKKDTIDRPHASYIYFGWNRYKLKKMYGKNFRVSTHINFGIVGGLIGEKFQVSLHQDVSSSLRPKGWISSIAYPGRLGIQYEKALEYELFSSKILKIIPTADLKFGSVYTKTGLGFAISNKSFNEINHHAISMRTKYEIKRFTDNLYFNLSMKAFNVRHNSLYSGYKFLGAHEPEKGDEFTPRSQFTLNEKYIRKWNYLVDFKTSYTTTFLTYFYSFYFISPEVTNFKQPREYSHYGSNVKYDLNKRWHRYAQLGISFNF